MNRAGFAIAKAALFFNADCQLSKKMDERIDILNVQGIPSGETRMKSEAHRLGLFHQTVHIWCFTKEGQILLQQRGKEKDINPLLWDVSVAGHIGAGEDIRMAAIREIREEIGYVALVDQLQKIGTFRALQRHHEHLIDNELHHIFLLPLQAELSELKRQQSEVEALRFISLSVFQKEVDDPQKVKTYVAHHPSYYQLVINAIQSRL